MLAPVRFSDLKFIERSPKHYRARLRKSTSVSASAERSMRFGSAAHKLILEPERDDICMFDGKVRNGKAWDAFKAAHAGALILKPSELAKAQACAQAVHDDPVAKLWLGGLHEHELKTWLFAGRECGGRPDIVGEDYVADVKTSADVSPRWFARAALRMGYHGQLAWYLDGSRAEFARSFTRAAIIAVEQAEPYDVVVYPVEQRALDQGARICHAWMEKLLQAEATGVWHGQALGPVPLDIPDEELGFIFEEETEEADSE